MCGIVPQVQSWRSLSAGSVLVGDTPSGAAYVPWSSNDPAYAAGRGALAQADATMVGGGVEKTDGRRTVSLMRSLAGCEDHATSMLI